MNNQTYPDLPKEKFVFVQREENIHDTSFETKPVGYFGDAWGRFKKNKSSVVAAVIIVLLIIFALFTPLFSTYSMSFTDSYYTFALPKCNLLAPLGIWDGCSQRTVNQQTYDYYSGMDAIVQASEPYEKSENGRSNTYYDVTLDMYRAVGYVYINLSTAEYESALSYQEETGIQLFQPMVDTSQIMLENNKTDANYWYQHDMKGIAQRDADGNLVPIYLTDENSADGLVYHSSKMNGNQYQVRVYYYDWFTYKNGQEPCFLFGTDKIGHDILSRLSSGARFSLLLSLDRKSVV